MSADTQKTPSERLSVMEKQVSEIHEALLGNQYNKSGAIIPRLEKAEAYIESHKKQRWLLTGLVALAGASASYAKEIIHYFTAK
jgi:hypothetical protein